MRRRLDRQEDAIDKGKLTLVLVLVAIGVALLLWWMDGGPADDVAVSPEGPVADGVVAEGTKAVVPATTISTVPSQQPIVVSGEDQVLEVEFHFVDAIDQQPITIDAIQISHIEPDRVTAVAIPLPEDGVFHIPFDEVVGKIQLVVTAEGYFRIQDSLQVDTPAKISIPLVPRATLHCLVRSLDARPLAGAMVRVLPPRSLEVPFRLATQPVGMMHEKVTDESGRCTIEDLIPSAGYRVVVEALQQPKVRIRDVVVTAPDSYLDVDVVAGATIRGSIGSGSDGIYSMMLFGGRSREQKIPGGPFEISGLAPGTKLLLFESSTPGRGVFARVRVADLAPGEVRDIGIVQFLEHEITIRVVDPDGHPVAGARVGILPSHEEDLDSPIDPNFTDSSGELVIRGVSANIRAVEVSPPKERRRDLELVAVVLDGQSDVVEIALRRALGVTGTIVNAHLLEPGVKVDWFLFRVDEGQIAINDFTDETEWFTNIYSARYRLMVSYPGYWAESDTFDGSATSVNLGLEKVGMISGRIRDLAAGSRFVEVSLYEGNSYPRATFGSPWFSTEATDSGEFEIPCIPGHDLRLVIRRDGRDIKVIFDIENCPSDGLDLGDLSMRQD